MIFSSLIEDPKETTVITVLWGLLISEGLNGRELGILGILLNLLSHEVLTLALLTIDHETAEKSGTTQNIKQAINAKDNMEKADAGNTLTILKELQQKNKCLQEQLWDLQKKLLTIHK